MKKIKIIIICISIIYGAGITFVFSGCQRDSNHSKNINLESEEAKFSYAVGYEIGNNMKRQKVKLSYDAFTTAVVDVMEGKQERLNKEERRAIMKSMSEKKRHDRKETAEKNKEAGETFLQENKKKEGVQATESGLQYKVVREGEGEKPVSKDTVKVHYRGTLIDGTQFDSSYDRKEPAEFPVRSVIPGWIEGLQLMSVGSKYEFYVPSNLGYGPRGSSVIPGNSVLIFEVELLSIVGKEGNDFQSGDIDAALDAKEKKTDADSPTKKDTTGEKAAKEEKVKK